MNNWIQMKFRICTILFSSLTLSLLTQTHAFSSTQKDSDHSVDMNKLVFSIPTKPDKLDPILSTNAHSKFTQSLIYETLVAINAQQTLQPVLASSWEISSDSKTVTIHIKPNHRFSDQTEVTANEIKASINRLCSPGSQEYGELRGLLGCVDHAKSKDIQTETRVLNKYTIQFKINSSPTTFLYELSSPSTAIVKSAGSHLIGSGPYELKRKTDTAIALDRNPYYFGDMKVNNDGITFLYASGNNVIGLLNERQIDGALMYRIEELASFNNETYKIIKSNPNITEILVLNNQRFPFNQPIVRKAIATEIFNNLDYSKIPGAHKSYGIIPAGIGGSITNIEPQNQPKITPQQVFAAVPQLKSHPVTLTIHQLADLKNDIESKQIIDSAKQYNINLKFQYHKDYSDLIPHYLNHDFDGFIDLYVYKNREAYKVFEFFTKSGENDANITTDNIDTILKEAIAMPTSHGRFEKYRELAQYIEDNHVIIPLFYMDHGNWLNKCLEGISEDFFFNPFWHLPQISKTNKCQHT